MNALESLRQKQLDAQKKYGTPSPPSSEEWIAQQNAAFDFQAAQREEKQTDKQKS